MRGVPEPPLCILHSLFPNPPGDIFSDKWTRAEETHFRVESKEWSSD
jgi:hypothetical protein